LGLEVNYDPAELAVHISVPTSLKPIQRISLAGGSGGTSLPELEPARVGVSVLLRSRVDHSYATQSDTHSLGFRTSLSQAFTLADWVAESDLSLNTRTEQSLSLDTLRILRDFPESGLRFSLGDVSYPTRGFQNGVPAFGVGLHTEDDLASGGLVRGLGSTNISISEPTEARFLVNGRTVRTEQLEPGRYDITDFPLLPGVNDVSVLLENRMGERTALDAVMPFASQLIPAGAYNYAAVLGFPRWRPTEPLFSGFLYRGFTRQLTAGVNAQASLKRQLLGIGGIYASRLGTVRVDLAGSRNEVGRTAPGVLGEYKLAFPQERWAPSFSLLGRYRGRSFGGLSVSADEGTSNAGGGADADATGGPAVDETPAQWGVTASVSQALPLGLRLSLTGRYRDYADATPRAASLSASLSRGFGEGVSATALVNARSVAGELDWSASVLVSASGRSTPTRVSVFQDIEQPTTRVRVAGGRELSVGDLSATGAVAGLPLFTETPTRLSGNLRLTNQRLETAASQAVQLGEGTGTTLGKVESLRASAQFGAGFYMADGVATIGRPAKGAFAMLAEPPDLPVESLRIGRGGPQAGPDTGALGTTVLPGLAGYSPTTVELQMIGLPVDYSVGRTSFTARPGYRRGMVIPVEAERLLYAQGRLLDADGEPVSLKALRLHPLDGDEPAMTTFTDEEGVFQLYDLRAGRYRLDAMSGQARTEPFQIRDGGDGFIDLGEVRLLRDGDESDAGRGNTQAQEAPAQEAPAQDGG
jgi:outer membrane usher protein